MRRFCLLALIVVMAPVMAYAATISQTPKPTSPLRATDKIPLGREGDPTAYAASVDQIMKYVYANYTGGGSRGPAGPQGPIGPQGPAGSPATNIITSVQGKTGAVVLTPSDIGAAPATAGASILKGNGSGGTTAATPGTDYLAPTGSGAGLTGIVKPSDLGTAAFSNRTSYPGTIPAAGVITDTDKVPFSRGGWLATTWSSIKSSLKTFFDGFYAPASQARKGATYTILPYGDTRLADYYCSATDCGPAFQTAYNVLKAAAKGGKIKTLDGTYPFVTTVDASDADSIIVEGIAPAGMWGSGGTIFSLNANLEMFYFGRVSQTARANVFKNIHFKGNSRPNAIIHSVNGFNFELDHNYFELCMPCLVAERPWDWQLSFNNYRSCGSGNTSATAAVVLANATVASDGGSVGDNGSGWHQQFDRYETRPGTSIFIQPSSSYTMNMVSVIGTKFEGIAGQAYPAVYGSLADSRLALNSCYYSDSNCFNIDSASYSNAIVDNFFSETAGSDIVVSGDDNIVAGNSFNYPAGGAAAHITVASGADGTVVSNNHKPSADTVPLLVNNGTNTDLDSLVTLSDWPAGLTPTELGYMNGVTSPIQAQLNSKAATSALPGVASLSVAGLVTVSGNTTKAASVSGTLTQGKQATFDANNNLVASNFDVGATGGGSTNWGSIGGTLSSQTDLNNALAAKQVELVSGTNIKSINGYSLLGSGDLLVSGMIYPSTGIPVSNGAGWDTSLGHGFGANNLLQLNSSGNIFLKATDGTNTQLQLQTRNGGGTIVSDWVISSTTTPQLTFFDVLSGHNLIALTPGAPENSFAMDSTGKIGFGTGSPSFMLHAQSSASQGAVLLLEDYFTGNGASGGVFGRFGRGSAASPLRGKANDRIFTIGARSAYAADDVSAGAMPSGNRAAINFFNAEDQTSTGQGSYISILTTNTGASAISEKVRVHAGGVSINTTAANHADPGAGSLSVANFIISGYEEKTASYTVSKDSGKITLASSTAVVTLLKTLKAGETSVLVTVAGAAASGVSFAAESGGSLSFGDAGSPTFINNKIADVVCISQNAADTTAAAWRCTKGGNF